MTSTTKTFWLILVGLICIGINSFFLENNIPILAIIAFSIIGLSIFLFRFDYLIYFVAFATPLSVNFYFSGLKLGFNFPSEPIMVGLMILFFLKLIIEGFPDRRIIKHPITLAISFILVWTFVTTLTSQLIFVSTKAFLAKLWFIIVFYFLIIYLFKNISNIKRFIWAYVFGFTIVIIYTWFQHAEYDFSQIKSYNVMMPFFPDHTLYGAMIAFFVFILAAFSFSSSINFSFQLKLYSFLFFLIFCVALFLSYSRGAWIGTVAAIAFYLLLVFRIKFHQLLIGIFLFGIVLLIKKDEIYVKLKSSEVQTTEKVSTHIESITNISSDVSNLERINRWNSALGMFKEKPFFGYGPGSYSFFYTRFQRLDQITDISSNFGDAGNGHSEYLMPLSESGFLGLVSFIILVLTVIYTGMKVHYSAKNNEIKYINLGALLGLVSYFVHGFINNFSDLDKGAVPLWAFIAIICILDIKNQEEIKSAKSIPLL